MEVWQDVNSQPFWCEPNKYGGDRGALCIATFVLGYGLHVFGFNKLNFKFSKFKILPLEKCLEVVIPKKKNIASSNSLFLQIFKILVICCSLSV